MSDDDSADGFEFPGDKPSSDDSSGDSDGEGMTEGGARAEMDAIAAGLAQDASESFEEHQEDQQAFLDAVSEEEGAEVLETQCNLIGEYTVPLRAKLDGELMDTMGAIDARLERLEQEEGRAYEFSETADDVSQLLADVIDDPEYHKQLFYEVYELEGLDALGALLETAFESLKAERERRQGVADGFRSNTEGT